MRYATTSTTDEVHLLTRTEDKTLCGLCVAPIIINRPASSAMLYLTETVDTARPLCGKCAAIETDSKDRQP
jgi:hypothetical protein